MKHIIILSLVIAMGLSTSCGDDSDDEQIEAPEGYVLVWNDEFNDKVLSSSYWSFEEGDGTAYGLPPGWGNSELQVYTSNPENITITSNESESVLAITALKQGEENFTSSKIVTKDKVNARFGRIEVRAKLPQGKGLWPAIWMIGDNKDEIAWPGCGEIDLVEVLGHQPSTMYSTLHYTGAENRKGETQGKYSLESGRFSTNYHVFSLDWTPEEMIFQVDGSLVHQVAIGDEMQEFLRSFYFVMNVAVGGEWPGNPDASSIFPQSMYVDYIRVFEKADFSPPSAPPLDKAVETLGQYIPDSVVQSAVQTGFDLFENMSIIAYGGGGEPFVSLSETRLDGLYSLLLDYQGENWGGAYFQLVNPIDISSYTYLEFALKKPDDMIDAEIKLESPISADAIFLTNYSGTDLTDGFKAYKIPLSDFDALNKTVVTIPFSFWNPMDATGNFIGGEVLLDNLHFSK